MSYLEAIILGLVQGFTEFIPISSSGHLVISNHLLGTTGNFAFDVLLNVGTLTALVVFYRQRIWSLITKSVQGREWRLIGLLLLATVPAFAVGLLYGEFIKQLNDMVWVVVVMLVFVGVIMIRYGSARENADDRPLEKSLTARTSIKVGLAQALALIPGTSRSGITILVGLQSRLSATRAAEFSFLLAIPTIAGATLKVAIFDGGMTFVQQNIGIVIVGNIASFLSGIIAVSFLIKLLGSRGLKDFGWYRVGLATVLAILLITGII